MRTEDAGISSRSAYRGPRHEGYLLRVRCGEDVAAVPVGLETAFTFAGRACRATVRSNKHGPLFLVTDAASGHTFQQGNPLERYAK